MEDEEDNSHTLGRKLTIGNGLSTYNCCNQSMFTVHLFFISPTNVVLNKKYFVPLGPPDSLHDWTKDGEFGGPSQTDANQAHSRKNWRLVRCQNGKFNSFYSCKVPVNTIPMRSIANLDLSFTGASFLVHV